MASKATSKKGGGWVVDTLLLNAVLITSYSDRVSRCPWKLFKANESQPFQYHRVIDNEVPCVTKMLPRYQF